MLDKESILDFHKLLKKCSGETCKTYIFRVFLGYTLAIHNNLLLDAKYNVLKLEYCSLYDTIMS